MNRKHLTLFGLLLAVSFICLRSAIGETVSTAPPPSKCQITGLFYEGEKPAPGGSFNLVLRLTFAEGYHAYQDQTKFELTSPRWQTGTFVPPPGVKTLDPASNAEVDYLEKTANLKLKIAVPPDAQNFQDTELKMSVSFLGCTGSACDLDPTNFYPAVKVSELEPVSFGGTVTVKPAPTPTISAASPAANETANGANAGKQNNASDGWFNFSKYGPWMALLFAFIAGILIAFTPCVFPMISVTMAVLAGGERKSKMRTFVKSLIYVLGISLTYGLLGVLLSLPGSQWKNELQYNPYIFPVVGLIFAALALSMFGLYEIRLPMLSAGKFRGEGLGRALLMGIIAGLVATPCVAAPLAALLIYVATQGSPLYGFAIMTAFAWGMGVILIIAGNFVSLLPGEWMDSVKKIFGWALLAVAIWLWQEQLGRYFYPALGVFLITAGMFAGAFKILSAGGWGKRTTRLFGLALIVLGALCLFKSMVPESGKVKFESVKSSEEFQQKLEQASKLGRPMFFYAHRNNCAACKEFEETVLVDRRVISLSEKFLCVEGNFSHFPLGDRGNKIRKSYSFETVPTILFFRPDKTVAMNLQDKQTSDIFLMNMRDVLGKK